MPESNAVTPEYHRQRARLLMETNRNDLAEVELRAAMALDPQDPLTLTELAWCLKNIGRDKESLSLARSATGINPELSVAHLTIACCLIKLERTREAWFALRTTLRLDPDNLQAHVVAIRMHLTARNWSSCITACDRALTLAPLESAIHGMRSLALFNLGRNEDAVAAARQAISCDPNAALSQTAIGLSHLDQKDYRSAVDAFREALRLDPNNPCAGMLLLVALKEDSSPLMRVSTHFSRILSALLVLGLPVLLLITCWRMPASLTWRVIGILAATLMLFPLLTSVMGNLLVARNRLGRKLLGPVTLTTSLVMVVMATMAAIKAAICLATGDWMITALLLVIACTPALVVMASEPGRFQRVACAVFCLAAVLAAIFAWSPASRVSEIGAVIYAWALIVWMFVGLNLGQPENYRKPSRR